MQPIHDPMFSPEGKHQQQPFERVDYLKLKDGENLLRVLHASSKSPNKLSTFDKISAWVPAELELTDGRITKSSNKRVFNSKHHGGTAKDLIDEYGFFIKKRVDQWFPNEADGPKKLDLLDKLAGKQTKGKYSVPSHKTTNMFYAISIQEGGNVRGLYEITSATARKIAALYADIASSGQAITGNPFTDLQNGFVIRIIMNTKAAPADYYKVALHTTWADQVTQQVMRLPVSQEDIDFIESQRTMEERFVNTFTMDDFELQIKGLQNFEIQFQAQYGMQLGIMADPEFIAIGESIRAEIQQKIDQGILKATSGKPAETPQPNQAPQPSAQPEALNQTAQGFGQPVAQANEVQTQQPGFGQPLPQGQPASQPVSPTQPTPGFVPDTPSSPVVANQEQNPYNVANPPQGSMFAQPSNPVPAENQTPPVNAENIEQRFNDFQQQQSEGGNQNFEDLRAKFGTPQ